MSHLGLAAAWFYRYTPWAVKLPCSLRRSPHRGWMRVWDFHTPGRKGKSWPVAWDFQGWWGGGKVGWLERVCLGVMSSYFTKWHWLCWLIRYQVSDARATSHKQKSFKWHKWGQGAQAFWILMDFAGSWHILENQQHVVVIQLGLQQLHVVKKKKKWLTMICCTYVWVYCWFWLFESPRCFGKSS